MNPPFEHGEPEDGDLVDAEQISEVPSDVKDAIRTLIRWAGDDPDREGLLDTPRRVACAWREYARGYEEDPAVHLSRTFEEVGGYDEIVLLKDIPFQSHCEHHHGADHRQGRDRLPAERQGRRHQQARARASRFCPAVAGAGAADRPGRRCIWDHLQPQGSRW